MQFQSPMFTGNFKALLNALPLALLWTTAFASEVQSLQLEEAGRSIPVEISIRQGNHYYLEQGSQPGFEGSQNTALTLKTKDSSGKTKTVTLNLVLPDSHEVLSENWLSFQFDDSLEFVAVSYSSPSQRAKVAIFSTAKIFDKFSLAPYLAAEPLTTQVHYIHPLRTASIAHSSLSRSPRSLVSLKTIRDLEGMPVSFQIQVEGPKFLGIAQGERGLGAQYGVEVKKGLITVDLNNDNGLISRAKSCIKSLLGF